MKQFITMIMVGCMTTLCSAQNNLQELTNTLNKETPVALKTNNVPGAAIAILENDKLLFSKGYGFADVANQIKVNKQSGFNIGSISKMFTAWGIMKLVEEGKLKLDAPITTYLEHWELPKSDFEITKVTVRGLLTHTAGLNVHGYNGYTTKDDLPSLIECLSGTSNPDEKVQIVSEPETKWNYSGGGYTILQLIIEEVSGISFEAYMQQNIFKPLHMKNTSFTINEAIIKTSAKAYDENGNKIPLRLFTAKAAAGLHTTLEDLILFAKASFSSNAVLSKESINQLITPTELSNGNYGMGYMVMNRFGNFTLSGHGGSNEGWQSGFMLDFETNSAIIILTNGDAGKNVLFGSMKTWAMWRSK